MSRSPALSAPSTRVLLVGSGHHVEGSALTSVPAVRRSVEALEQVLVDRCGLDPADLRVIHDPSTPQEFGEAVTEAANQAESVLILYYVGHGLVGAANGELYLATYGTDDLVVATPAPAAHDLGPPTRNEDPALRLGFAPDGRTLTALGIDGSVTHWDLGDLVDLQAHARERACGIVGAGLDEETWQRFIPDLPWSATC